MQLDLQRVRDNVRQATDEDLLDRLTVFAKEMEPDALEIIEAELRGRGVSTDGILDHYQKRRAEGVLEENGVVCRCSFCIRPATGRRWGWHFLWGLLPLFPCRFRYCRMHDTKHKTESEA